jgi:hypothetical protein
VIEAFWTQAQDLYRQCVDILSEPENTFVPEPVVDRFAASINKVSDRYLAMEQEDYAQEFVSDAVRFLDVVSLESPEEKFKKLYDGEIFKKYVPYAPPTAKGRRRPAPFESLVETARRIRDTDSLQSALGEVACAALSGGSVSYGRFFNVSGVFATEGETKPGSDIDILLVCDDLSSVPDALRLWTGASTADVDTMSDRAVDFLEWSAKLRTDDRPVFSHKLSLWADPDEPDPLCARFGFPGNYQASIHVCSMAVFSWLLCSDKDRLGSSGSGDQRIVTDFRPEESTRVDQQRDFSGALHSLPIANEPINGGNFARKTYAYYVAEGEKYLPGFFQNLVLPSFEVRWDFPVSKTEKSPVQRLVTDFQNKIHQRIAFENQKRPYEHLEVSLSHTRRGSFAPHVVRRVDHVE